MPFADIQPRRPAHPEGEGILPLPTPRASSMGFPWRWLRGLTRRQHARPLPAGMRAAKRRRRVLIAEDDVPMRIMLASVLRRDGYEVEECGNGLLLLMKFGSFLDLGRVGDAHSFAASPDAENFDLIISDIRLPGATGLEVLERSRRRRHYPPVILMTAFGDDDTHAQAHRLGAAAVFDKPFETDSLLAEVRAIAPT